MTFFIVALGVLVAFTIEAMTGFGSIVVALSIGALVMNIHDLMQWLVPLNILMTGPLVFRHRRHIDYDLLIKHILPLMGLGTLVGVLATGYLPELFSKGLFALIVCWFAIRSLAHLHAPAHSALTRGALIFSAGITHGLFASGGPLLVYACARSAMDKARFRATLLSVWLTLNTALTLWFLLFDNLASQATHIAWLVPCVVAGALCGNALHNKVSQAQFSRVVFGLLLLVGVLLLAKTISQLVG
ncbi:TSUP family transporter [Alteromonas sp. CYL-A6]|uniref:TSUP family transporter n=1 Tax=Alteromonas nitratireducens TaxID=3390813 RepID=UPI0034A6D90E